MHPVVSVQRVGDASQAPWVRHLRPGQSVRFLTCSCRGCEADLVVPAPRRIPAAGRVAAYPDHWRLDNPGQAPLTVENLEQSQDLITVPAGRDGVVVPFELARVNAGQVRLVTVFGPEPAGRPAGVPLCPGTGGRIERALDPHSTYFAVLVALCEPRLRRSAEAGLPTSAEIAQRLGHRGIAITPRAVDWHIEYLIDKLGLRPGCPAGRAKRSWRKEAVAAAALRGLLVGPEHIRGPADPAPRIRGRAARRPAPGMAQFQGDHG